MTVKVIQTQNQFDSQQIEPMMIDASDDFLDQNKG